MKESVSLPSLLGKESERKTKRNKEYKTIQD